MKRILWVLLIGVVVGCIISSDHACVVSDHRLKHHLQLSTNLKIGIEVFTFSEFLALYSAKIN